MKPARIERERAGLTIGQAAKAVRLSVSSLRKIEAGYPASWRAMQELARLYGSQSDQPFRRHTAKREGGREMSTRKPGRGSAPAGGEAR